MALKLLHILGELNYSGAETLICRSMPFFRQKKVSITVLSTGATIGDYAPLMQEAGIDIVHLPFAKTTRFFTGVFRLLLKEKFDAVHIHTEQAFILYAFLARTVAVPCVLRSVHSIFAFKGGLRWQRYLMRQACRHIFRVPFIAVSPDVARTEQAVYNLTCLPLTNAVETTMFYPPGHNSDRIRMKKKLGLPPGAFVLCTAGSCTDVKNHEDIIRAMARLHDGALDLRLLHLGCGPREDREKRLAAKLGLSDQMIYMGQVKEVREAFWATDLFVMPSRYEGLGMACLEAMACGLPAVVYDVPGLRALVRHGTTGLVVRADPDALSEAILTLLKDQALMRRMGRDAARHAAATYSFSAFLESFYAIYTRKDNTLARRHRADHE